MLTVSNILSYGGYMKNEQFTSFDGTVIQCYLWDEVESPKAVLQIAHGMAEHARRYDDFAKYLNANGIIVFADDHRAHGATCVGQSKKGVKGYQKGEIYKADPRLSMWIYPLNWLD